MSSNYIRKIFLLRTFIFAFFLIMFTTVSSADLYINILAVNGAEVAQDKNIRHFLPKGLTRDDIIDTDGLQVQYDVEQGSYAVMGTAKLKPKESKTYKVRIKDIWKIDENEIIGIMGEIDKNLERIKDTEYYPSGQIKKEALLQRLDYIAKEQARYADNIEQRIGRYQIYESELEEIREKALSIKYWRSRPPTTDEADVFTYIVEMENPNKEEEAVLSPKHYVPKEVKPEHFVELQGFEVKYDASRGKSYLQKEEKLKAGEKKRYEIGIIDIWRIKENEIGSLRDRTDKALDLLKETEFLDSAQYLSEGIYKNLDFIDESQLEARPIGDHISVYRRNLEIFKRTRSDVEALERLLEALREDLERSKVKKVLQRIADMPKLANMVKTIFKKPDINTAWKIILGIVAFVGTITLINFIIWVARSKDSEIKDVDEQESEEKKEDQEE